MNPRISFVVPYYEKPHTIKRCLQSLMQQSTKKEIEIIVVLDGPDKDAERLIKKTLRHFKQHQIHVLPVNRGAPAARNAGLAVAQGEFISFWDADSVIEPGAARVWLQVFDKWSEVDFVYAGYQFEEGMGGVASRPFDKYLLKINNYISGHFPIRREKCPWWDESLKSLQDWDFWLTAVENGCEGKFIRGYAFRTPLPSRGSISADSHAHWIERWETVKKKHNIPMRDTCIGSLTVEDVGIVLAKILEIDYNAMPTFKPNRYKTLVQIGFDPAQADKHAEAFAQKESKKVLFWTGLDCQRLLQSPFAAVEGLTAILNELLDFQFCEDKDCKRILEKIGFKVEIFPLPLQFEKVEVEPFPEERKFIVDMDARFEEFFASIARNMPDIRIDILRDHANIDDYCALVSFNEDRTMTPLVKRALLSGRRVISNIVSPRCNFVEHRNISAEETRKRMIRIIRHIHTFEKPDYTASALAGAEFSPGKFKEEFERRMKDEVPRRELCNTGA